MNEDIYISVKKYLSGQLSESEVLEFEKQVEEDSHFREEVKLYANIVEAISHRGDEELGAELMTLGKELLQKEQPNEGRVRKLKIPYYAYAIAAAILLLIIILPIWPPSTSTPEDLFSSRFEPPYSTARSGNDITTEIDSLEDKWRISYENGKYSDAVSTLLLLLADSSYQERSNANYFLGACQLTLGNPDAALDAFESIDEGFESQEKVEWYIAPTILKKGDIPEVRKRLQTIVEDDKFRTKNDLKKIYEDAQYILKRLPKE